jgi:hypothetical protein
MDNYLVQDNVFLPLRNLTVFYSGDMPIHLELPGVKSYTFHMDRNEILQKFKILSKKDRVLGAVKAILGFSKFEYDEKDDTFKADNDISHKIDQLSTGTAQALGVCTIALNPMVFGGERGLMIRHPEASLHPKSQSALGQLLVEVYMSNSKIHGKKLPRFFVDTWSDHILNGMRVATLQKKMNPENFVLNYIKGGSGMSIWLSQKGEFSAWPEGFMDQHSKDLMNLLGF